MQWNKGDADSLIGTRVLLLQPAAYGIEFRPSLLKCRSGIHPRPYIKIVSISKFARILVWYERMSWHDPRRRHPQLAVFVRRKVRGHHTNHGVLLAIKLDVAANYRVIRSKIALPQAVAQHHNVIAAGRRVARHESTSENWIHSKQREKTWRRHCALDALGAITSGHAGLPAAGSRDLGEDMILRSPIQVVGGRGVARLHALKRLRNRYNAIRIRIWKRMQEHLVYDAEDRRGAADAECQGNDGDRGEAWVFD